MYLILRGAFTLRQLNGDDLLVDMRGDRGVEAEDIIRNKDLVQTLHEYSPDGVLPIPTLQAGFTELNAECRHALSASSKAAHVQAWSKEKARLTSKVWAAYRRQSKAPGESKNKDLEEMKKVHQALDLIVEKTLSLGGTITGEHGVGLAKKPWLRDQLGDVSLGLMKKFKETIDPENLLNPHKIFD